MQNENDRFLELVNHTKIASKICLFLSIIGMISSTIGIVYQLGEIPLFVTSFLVCSSTYILACHILSLTE